MAAASRRLLAAGETGSSIVRRARSKVGTPQPWVSRAEPPDMGSTSTPYMGYPKGESVYLRVSAETIKFSAE
ncbi:hypothetical protein GCM10023196_091030 [Actinoallomurus vinaceus]|uniref:Uncharacterized protein n=1 Tax=Actinoallomurus vinaceus TaxID=1080074 RepID=A0ABP8UQC4_9ACTN